MTTAAKLDVQIFAGAAELALRRYDLARAFLRLAAHYRDLAMQSTVVAEDAARRLGIEIENIDAFDRAITPDLLRELEARDERGAA